MLTLLWIVIGVAVVFGLIALLASNKSDPKERAAEAAAAAAGGAMMAGGCVFQLIILGVLAFIGLAILGFIFGK